jgi:hypothetical protein
VALKLHYQFYVIFLGLSVLPSHALPYLPAPDLSAPPSVTDLVRSRGRPGRCTWLLRFGPDLGDASPKGRLFQLITKVRNRINPTHSIRSGSFLGDLDVRGWRGAWKATILFKFYVTAGIIKAI